MTKRISLLLLSLITLVLSSRATDITIDGITYRSVMGTASAPGCYIVSKVDASAGPNVVILNTITSGSSEIPVTQWSSSNIAKVKLPDNVTSLTLPPNFEILGMGSYTFSLERLILQDTTEPIGTHWWGSENPRIDQVSLKHLYLGRLLNDLTTCYWQSSLETLEVGKLMTNIQPEYFKGFTQLQSVTLGENMTTVDEGLFEGCSALTTINFSDKIETIGARAFKDCTSLTSVVIPSSVKTIDASAFEGCTNLKSLVISDGTLIIGANAFKGCTSLANVSLSNTVQTISDNAFEGCSSLGFVGIPASVTTIGAEAFKDCSSLDYILMGRGLTSIGADAFAGCSALSEVEIEDRTSWCAVQLANEQANPLYFGHKLSMRGMEIKNLTIPSGVQNISDYTFIGCTDVQTLSLPASVTTIGKKAFSESGITALNTSANLTTIGEQAFADALSLKTVVCADAVSNIGTEAFAGCSALTSINVGDGLGTVASRAFADCSALQSVNTTSIAGWVATKFADPQANPVYYAKNLTLNGNALPNLIVDSGAESISDYAFHNCESLQTVNTGATVTTVGNQAFMGCSNIKEFVLADAVTTVGKEFCKDAVSLTSISFGAKVNSIGEGMLLGCLALKEVNVFMTTAPLQTAACFESLAYSNAVLYVPAAAYATYRITQPWQGFRRIYELGLNFDEESMGIEAGKKTLNVGETLQLEVTANPPSLLDNLTWTSSNPDVATVDENGNVTAVKPGTTTITASVGEDLSVEFELSVVQPSSSITIDKETAEILLGKTLQLTATVLPENATDKQVTWTSSDESVATVDASGLVTANKCGQATITATASNGLSASCEISVVLPATSVVVDLVASGIEGDDLYLNIGETREIKVVMTPAGSSDTLTWTSSDTKVATVVDGKVTAVAAGTAIITITTTSGKSTELTVIVRKPVTDITIDLEASGITADGLTLNVGESHKVIVKFTPEDATDTSLSWSSSDSSVATVDSEGNVTGVAKGEATITIKSGNGISTTFKVTVVKPVTDIEIDLEASGITADGLTLNVGESHKVIVKFTPEDATDTSLAWSSSDTSVATVDSEGNVTGVAKGEATITIKSENGISTTFKVTVVKPVTDIDIDLEASGITADGLTLNVGDTKEIVVNIYPEDASDITLNWHSADDTVATVDNGLVTAIAPGETTISISASNGITTEVKVTVLKTNSIESIIAGENGNADIFTLQGIKVSKAVKELAPGIYIINGHKYIIK